MAMFLPFLTKKYSPYDIDQNMFSMYCQTTRSIPIIATSMVGKDYFGKVTVNGKEISKGKCFKFDFSPLPFLMIPVGEVATEFNSKYKVKLTGFRNNKGHKFLPCSFTLKTLEKHQDDGKHIENENVAKLASDEGITLLTNNGILPLKENTTIALKGDYKDFRISAIGAGLIKPRWQLSIEEAIEKNGKLKIDDNSTTCLYFISRGSGEGRDNKPIAGFYYLTEQEKSDLKDSCDKYQNVILILNTGYPIEMKYINSLNISAIIWTGFSGQRGSESLIDIITGVVNPSGRLADSWPMDYYDLPVSKNFINLTEDNPTYSDNSQQFGAKIYYEEKEFIGYRYFDTFNVKPAFYFGSGLSYSTFDIQSYVEYDNEKIKVEATVTNTSNVSGKYSVLVYVKRPKSDVLEPLKVFVGFEKTKILDYYKSNKLTIEIPNKDFATYDKNLKAFVLRKGIYDVYVGGSILDATEVFSFEIDEQKIVEQTISVSKETEDVGSIDENGNVKERSGIVNISEVNTHPAKFEKTSYKPLKKYTGEIITFDQVKNDISKLDDFVSQFSVKELVDFTILNGSCWGINQIGAAGKIAHSDKYGIPTFYMSDGNTGVNLYKMTTGFPSSNLIASTFSKDIAYMVGKTIALESKENNISINLGPAGNLHRNILCGRHAEYFSEDPILAGTFMAYHAKGLEENGTLACYKHFFANNVETERKAAHSLIDETTLRNLYLRVFDKALSLYKPSTIMTSYNPVNGIYPCQSDSLINSLLRENWHFDGFVMTDWGSYDTADSNMMINAGTNLLCPGSKKYVKKTLKAVKKGEIKIATLQESVKRIIKELVKCI